MSKDTPLISVVIPSYNRAHLIGATIENVLAQTFTDFELIVVNDGSSDDTDAAVAPYRDKIVYLKQENKGLTGARNAGLRAAKGEWIALQDSDDLWAPNKLEQQVADMRAHPKQDVFFLEAVLQRPHLGKDVLSYEHSGFSQHLAREGYTLIERPLHYHITYGVAWVQATLVRKSLLFEIGLYDEWLTLFTDLDLFCRLALKGPWVFNPLPLVTIQRIGDENANVSSQRGKTPAKPYRNMAYILEKVRNAPGLNDHERQTISARLYNSYSGLGNELMKAGDVHGARLSFRKAFRSQKRPGALVKTLASVFRRQTAESPFRPVPREKIPQAD